MITKLYTTVRDNDDLLQFQHDLDTIVEWSNIWQLSFSFSKCKHLQVGKTFSLDYNLMDYQNDVRKTISHVDNEQDLGVWCTADLKPSLQCQHVVSKAMKVLGLIKRTFKFFSSVSLLILYKMYVYPHLEYCVQVWSPFLAGDINALERVQHRATKLIPTIANLSYEQRLKLLDLQSLYARRLRGDLIETYKILNGLTGTHINNYFTLNTNSITRGHSMKLFKERSRLSISIFSNCIVNCWNGLPEYVINAESINSFKNRLNNYWKITGYGYLQMPLA